MSNKIADEKLLLFHEVLQLLKKYNVDYWLDQGSLLGTVRDNAFITWDHDVDMGAWFEDIDDVRKLTGELEKTGALVSFFQYVVKIRLRKNNVDSIPVNIRFYYCKDGYAYSEFWSVMNKKFVFNKLFKGLMRVSGKLVNRIYAAGKEKSFFIKPLLWLSRNLYKLSITMREMFKVRRIIFRADEKYFRNLKDKKLYGIDVRIPEKSEKYLEFKYGKNWKVPVKDWVWYRDDGALYKIDMFKVGFSGIRKRLNRD